MSLLQRRLFSKFFYELLWLRELLSAILFFEFLSELGYELLSELGCELLSKLLACSLARSSWRARR